MPNLPNAGSGPMLVEQLDFTRDLLSESAIRPARWKDNISNSDLPDEPDNLTLNYLSQLAVSLGHNAVSVPSFGRDLLYATSVEHFLRRSIDSELTTETFFSAFIAAARHKLAELQSSDGKEERRAIARPLDTKTRALFVRRKVLNWLQLAGLSDSVHYDQLHTLNAYNFMQKEAPNPFAIRVADRLVGKSVLSLGSGNATDEKFFIEQGASSVDIAESSFAAHEHVQSTRTKIAANLRERLIVPEQPKGIFAHLEEHVTEGKKVDAVYCHSFVHYFDDASFGKLIDLIFDCLTDNGEFIFAVKAPGAILDGNGIPLLQRELDGTVTKSYLNNDGQVRFFRNQPALAELISDRPDSHRFAIEEFSEFEVDDYDTVGSQPFYGFVLKKQ